VGQRILGDVAFDEVAPKASLIAPATGGVGPCTIAMLLKNTVAAAQAQSTRAQSPAPEPAYLRGIA
jgi:methylenetetrahydrofolate dehydrogenase (NADP+)/methenyltetrahydrofolate cyclohydrolase